MDIIPPKGHKKTCSFVIMYLRKQQISSFDHRNSFYRFKAKLFYNTQLLHETKLLGIEVYLKYVKLTAQKHINLFI